MITEEDYEKILRNFETGLSVSGLMAIERREGCETFGNYGVLLLHNIIPKIT